MAFGNATFANAGGAVADLLGGKATAAGLRLKAHGDRVEGDLYSDAADLAQQNEEFTRQSTAVKLFQQERESYKILGGQQADIAGSGFMDSGTALDLMRDSASQAALSHALIGQQGNIAEEGYQQQAKSFRMMAGSARYAAGVEEEQADTAIRNSYITGGIKAASSLATLFV